MILSSRLNGTAGLAATLLAAASLVFFSTESRAEDEQPLAHSVSYSLEAGKSDYRVHGLSARFGLSSKLKLLASATSTRLGSEDLTREYEIGFDWRPLPLHRMRIAGSSSSGTPTLMPRSIDVDYSFDLASVWEGERALDLELGYEHIEYRNAEGSEVFSQDAVSFGLVAELVEGLDGSVSYKRYSQMILSPTASRYVRLFNLLMARNTDLIPQEYQFSADLSLMLGEADRLGVSASYSKTLGVDERTFSPALDYSHDFSRRWTGGVGISTSMTQGSASSSSANLSLTFRF